MKGLEDVKITREKKEKRKHYYFTFRSIPSIFGVLV